MPQSVRGSEKAWGPRQKAPELYSNFLRREPRIGAGVNVAGRSEGGRELARPMFQRARFSSRTASKAHDRTVRGSDRDTRLKSAHFASVVSGVSYESPGE